MSDPSKIPTLPASHSGIPVRLQKEAQNAKEKTNASKTLPDSVPRKSKIRLPPNTSQEKFDIAIQDLQKLLGEDGLEINGGPLRDGWYMEHPYVGPTKFPLVM